MKFRTQNFCVCSGDHAVGECYAVPVNEDTLAGNACSCIDIACFEILKSNIPERANNISRVELEAIFADAFTVPVQTERGFLPKVCCVVLPARKSDFVSPG